MQAWQQRPLDEIYAAVFIDALMVKIRVLSLIMWRGGSILPPGCCVVDELLPHLSALGIEKVQRYPDRVVLDARARAVSAACGRCGQVSRRVHGGYARQLRDAPAGGVQVVIGLRVRRFRCSNDRCPAVTFAGQVPGLTSPHSRFTPLLRGLLTQIGLALAGRAGARLAAAAGVVVGRDTLLRLVKALPEPVPGPVPVLGVDDFAFRKGRRYGTVLIDMITHRPVEVFDGRDGADLAAWLRQHPEVAVVCRDRSGGYGEGARAGAPQAVQVADRFHLWQNLGQAVEKTVTAHRARLGEPPPRAAGQAPPRVVQPAAELKIVTRISQHYAAVQELSAQGLPKTVIGRKLGLHPATVRKFATASSLADLIAKTQQRAHLVDPYTAHLRRRWREGERNATTLARICRRDRDLDRLAAQVRDFAEMMTSRHGDRLDAWITNAEHDSLPALAAFARNLRRDLDAIRHGLTLPYNSGPVEGCINRLKMLKRQMFGRASLDLLRKRTLLAH